VRNRKAENQSRWTRSAIPEHGRLKAVAQSLSKADDLAYDTYQAALGRIGVTYKGETIDNPRRLAALAPQQEGYATEA
jgi:hypothetical protein